LDVLFEWGDPPCLKIYFFGPVALGDGNKQQDFSRKLNSTKQPQITYLRVGTTDVSITLAYRMIDLNF
jgi:hypothetical protein